MDKAKIQIKLKEALKKPSVVSEAFFQIAILIVSIFAFSVLIAAPIPVVKAAQPACCEKVKDSGLFCQNSMSDTCNTAFKSAPTACASTSFCKLGCCYDSVEGTCAENTPRKLCELRNGTFDVNADCKIAQCSLGCCVLGSDASLTTLVKCKKLASYYGLETDFRSGITTESACVAIAQSQDKGACVIDTATERTCKFATRAECKTLTRNESAFYKDFLCSAEQLGTNCARQARTGCIEGKDEVYWFDSCGNAENIYDSDKTRSYNFGKILSKEKSCDPNENNAKDPSCGNCQYYLGSMCGKARTGVEPRPASGDYICRDLNCYKTSNGNDYKHGESWCVFDGLVGKGRDAPGSRHWRNLCVQGEEKVEPCDDYRQAICVQDSVKVEGSGNFTEAMCRANAWKMCFDYNTKPNVEKACKDNNDCMYMELNTVATKSKMCVPNFPPGFNLKTEGGGLSANTYCSMATQSCTVIYQKTLKSGWKCIQNCECKEKNWINAISKFCTSLGDCGGKYNIAGKFTDDGYQISGTQNEPDKNVSNQDAGMGQFGGILFAGGVAIGVGILFNSFHFIPVSGETALEAAKFFGGTQKGVTSLKGLKLGYAPGKELTLNQWLTINAQQGGFANLAVNVAGAYLTSILINQMFGLKGEAANTVTMTGVSTAALTSMAGFVKGFGGATGKWLLLGPKGPWFGPLIWAVVAMIIVAIILKVMKIGSTRTETVTFTCMPWQPPTGGEDCEKCNKAPLGGPMKPCSKYRCESLGTGCSLLNEGTGKDICAWLNKDDTNAPTIKPWDGVLTKDHSYQSVKPCPPGPGCWNIIRQGAQDGCIKAFTPLTFGIETNEPAQCKVDTNHTSKFDDMQFFFGDNLYMYNHSMQMSLPAPAHINAQLESPELKNDGKYTLYARCRDGNGNWNLGEMAMQFCVDPGPDTTPATVMRTGIENGAPVAYGTKNSDLDVYLNEPAECKWSKTDQDYSNMNSTFACSSSLEQMEWDMTYKCSTTLTKIQDKVENKFYFRCRDQPWLIGTANESDRNVNKESYVFTLKGTIPLNITKIEPNGTIKYGSEPVPVTLKIETSNGYNNGDASCYFSPAGYENAMVEFFTTGSSIHEQKLDLYAAENNTYYVLCRDLGGNTDKAITSFKTEVDRTAPLIVRVYQDAGMLKIITDEESECRYSIKDCKFDFTAATEMPFTTSTEHTADWRTDITYYIKCRDIYGNMPAPSECSMQVNAYDVPTG